MCGFINSPATKFGANDLPEVAGLNLIREGA
jgi:hypothetical protein